MERTRSTICALHLLNVLLLLPHHHHSTFAQTIPVPSYTNLSKTWTANELVLSNSTLYEYLTCGFSCRGGDKSCLFTVHVAGTRDEPRIRLWSANRDTPVGGNATLQLTSDGDLVLEDSDGTRAWSTNTAGRGVVGMRLTQWGNLVLFDAKDAAVWQSFDHPTDTLVSGQRLLKGQRLTADASQSNWTRGPIFIASMPYGSSAPYGFGAFVDTNPPLIYYSLSAYPEDFPGVTSEAFAFFADPSNQRDKRGTTLQFLRLEHTGHIRVYECLKDCTVTIDKTAKHYQACNYPLVCGSYGICGSEQQCSCPTATADGNATTFFRFVDDSQANLGCSLVTPLSCESPQQHRLLPLGSLASAVYNEYVDSYPIVTTEQRCKEACLSNCSCKAALYQNTSYSNSSNGSCFLQQDVLSFYNDPSYSGSSRAYVKVQVIPPEASSRHPSKNPSNVRAIAGAVVGVLVTAGIAAVLLYRRAIARAKEKEEEEEDDFPQLSGMPTRFSYEDMRSATGNFCSKLGRGGFGSVFEGALEDGTKVAIKKLEAVSQGKKEFLAEVETIGSIHHLNLVRLLGFCAERSHRLLVYEYMSNGSLDRWIFHKQQDIDELSWEVLRKIIHQVAKGLSYLHEECRQKIAHLDIKPENILLDSNFDAKVSDFGLAKMIDRDQSAVMTMMRGTPGYLAPEWLLTSMITEKVDVYSFGVVVVEIVCGRRNVDFSQPEGCAHLLPLIKDNAMMGRLLDVVDKNKRDVGRDGEELEAMLKLAIWCLQYDPSGRPAMSTVVKVLEGAATITPDLDYNFGIPTLNLGHKIDDHSSGSTPLLPSVLSGPR